METPKKPISKEEWAAWGKKGGSSTSIKKALAVAKNAAIARQKKHERRLKALAEKTKPSEQ